MKLTGTGPVSKNKTRRIPGVRVERMVMQLKTFETETIDRLFLELRQFSKARTPDELKYDRLIYAVATKFPEEDSFKTALRYITQAENRTAQVCSSVKA